MQLPLCRFLQRFALGIFRMSAALLPTPQGSKPLLSRCPKSPVPAMPNLCVLLCMGIDFGFVAVYTVYIQYIQYTVANSIAVLLCNRTLEHFTS